MFDLAHWVTLLITTFRSRQSILVGFHIGTAKLHMSLFANVFCYCCRSSKDGRAQNLRWSNAFEYFVVRRLSPSVPALKFSTNTSRLVHSNETCILVKQIIFVLVCWWLVAGVVGILTVGWSNQRQCPGSNTFVLAITTYHTEGSVFYFHRCLMVIFSSVFLH
jgi:hypothetical protein